MLGFWKNTRGNVAVIFALALIPITFTVGASVDLSRMRGERTKLQAAVDAAVLAAARMPGNATQAQLEAEVNEYLAANYRGEGVINVLSVTRGQNNSIEVDASADVPMTFTSLFGSDNRPVSALAAAERGGVNLEMSLVLDVTGSMGGDLGSLQAAARTLVNSVVQDVQTPYYSKAAIIPYSAAVNLGDLADEARGDPIPPKLITEYSGENSGGLDIEDATRERPVEVETYDNHWLSDNDYVRIYGARGMTELNGVTFRVDRRAAKKVDLYDYWGNRIDGRWWGNYTGGGKLYECDNWWCNNVDPAEDSFVSENHGFSSGDWVHVDDVGGMSYIDGFYRVEKVSDDRLNFEDASTWGDYSGGGEITCTTYGCKYLRFYDPPNWWGEQDLHYWTMTQCVSERTGDEAYTDAAPSDAPVGIVYASSASGGECPSTEVVPLTSNKGYLIGKINNLSTGGATAGQIGIAWGWYTLSPNFNEMWSASSDAAAYDAPQTLKVTVIMTDGAFNTAYCNGVQSKDYGGDIDCDATNGGPFSQAEKLCDGMKAAGIRIYTVGYRLRENSQEEGIMEYCATDDASSFLASNGQALQSAFAQIGDSIGQLRLTR